MIASFWTGGQNAYTAGIRVEYKAKLADLKSALDRCEDQLARADIEQEILIIQADFKAKQHQRGWLIF